MIELRLIEQDGIEALEPAWAELAARAARTPFELPAWLIPWLHHYGDEGHVVVLTWWRGGDLVGALPLIRRRRRMLGLSIRELEPWGRTRTPLSGWVDLVADEDVTAEVAADLVGWLAHPDRGWDLVDYLHLDRGSPLLAAVDEARPGWRRVDLSGVLHSLEYEISLPRDEPGWRGPLGAKARRETERETRNFERAGGQVTVLADPAAAPSTVAALAALLSDAWGDREAYFRRDPRFRAFLEAALGRLLADGSAQVFEARAADGVSADGVAACLVTLSTRDRTVATLIGVSRREAYRSMSLGKGLFQRSIVDAAARGSRSYSFLTESDEYKRTFWHAQGRHLESGFFARGLRGAAITASAAARRLVPERARGRRRGSGASPEA